MYEAFFGLKERPFAAAPQASRYYPAAAIEGSRQTLSRCIERAEGAALLIGPAGTGKTLLCQVLAEQFREKFEIALLDSGRLCTRRALLQAILFELGLPYRGMEEGELRLSLIDHLSPRENFPSGMVLLIDEAHTLPLRLLEEVRMITNLVRGGQPRVRLVLAGGPMLEERFASPKLESFNQRLAARCYLQAMDRNDTLGYVRAQITAAGGNIDKMFSPDALDAVYRASDGIPRLANQVCDHALILAAAGGVRQINKAGIEESWSDLQQLPTPWNAAPGVSQPAADLVEFGTLEDEAPDEVQAVPFRPLVIAQQPEAYEPIAQLEQIQSQLAAIDDEFHPAGSIVPEVELVFNGAMDPFHEEFEEEEVVIDRYASMEIDLLRDRPIVHSTEGRQLSALLSSMAIADAPSLTLADIGGSAGDFAGKPEQSRSSNPAADKNQAVAVSAGQILTSTSVTIGDLAPAATVHTNAPVAEPYSLPKEAVASDDFNDDDLILVEDDAHEGVARPAASVRRQEYRQLFAKLRRG